MADPDARYTAMMPAVRHFSAKFRCEDLGKDRWLLRSLEPPDVQIHVHAAGVRVAGEPETFQGVRIEWGGATLLTLGSARGDRSRRVQDVVVHEPRGHLYDALPLARFDDPARRFWRRVFTRHNPPGLLSIGAPAPRLLTCIWETHQGCAPWIRAHSPAFKSS